MKIQIKKYASGYCSTPSLPGQMFKSQEELIKAVKCAGHEEDPWEELLRVATSALKLDAIARTPEQHMQAAETHDRAIAYAKRCLAVHEEMSDFHKSKVRSGS